MKLYEITGEYREIQAALEEAGGELTAEIEARLNANQETLAQKLENIAKLDAELQSGVTACKEEKKRLDMLADSRQNAIDSLRAYALRCLQAAGIKKVETPLFVVLRQANPPHVVVEDEGDIPRHFYVEKTQCNLNKIALRDFLKANPETIIPGVHLEAGESLRIK